MNETLLDRRKFLIDLSYFPFGVSVKPIIFTDVVSVQIVSCRDKITLALFQQSVRNVCLKFVRDEIKSHRIFGKCCGCFS